MKRLLLTTIIALACSFDNISEAKTLKTSFYKSGRLTASGERFNPFGNTAASNQYMFGTILRLTYGKKSVKVCVNDTGGFVKYGRHLDVTKGVASKLKFIKKGVVIVKVKALHIPKSKESCKGVLYG